MVMHYHSCNYKSLKSQSLSIFTHFIHCLLFDNVRCPHLSFCNFFQIVKVAIFRFFFILEQLKIISVTSSGTYIQAFTLPLFEQDDVSFLQLHPTNMGAKFSFHLKSVWGNTFTLMSININNFHFSFTHSSAKYSNIQQRGTNQ